MEDVIEQLRSGDMTNRQQFIDHFIEPTRNLVKRYVRQRRLVGWKDYLGEGFLALCLVPDELAAGRYKNSSKRDAVWKYIRTRVITRLYRWRNINHLMRIPYTTLAENPDMVPFQQVTHVFPGEKFRNEKTPHVPVPIFDLLSSPVAKETVSLKYKDLTGTEARMVEDIKQGELSINQMATKYCVSRQSIWKRIKGLEAKVIIE